MSNQADLDALVADRDGWASKAQENLAGWNMATNRAEDAEAERDLARTKLMDMHTWGEEWKVEARTAKKELDRLRKALTYHQCEGPELPCPVCAALKDAA